MIRCYSQRNNTENRARNSAFGFWVVKGKVCHRKFGTVFANAYQIEIMLSASWSFSCHMHFGCFHGPWCSRRTEWTENSCRIPVNAARCWHYFCCCCCCFWRCKYVELFWWNYQSVLCDCTRRDNPNDAHPQNPHSEFHYIHLAKWASLRAPMMVMMVKNECTAIHRKREIIVYWCVYPCSQSFEKPKWNRIEWQKLVDIVVFSVHLKDAFIENFNSLISILSGCGCCAARGPWCRVAIVSFSVLSLRWRCGAGNMYIYRSK